MEPSVNCDQWRRNLCYSQQNVYYKTLERAVKHITRRDSYSKRYREEIPTNNKLKSTANVDEVGSDCGVRPCLLSQSYSRVAKWRSLTLAAPPETPLQPPAHGTTPLHAHTNSILDALNLFIINDLIKFHHGQRNHLWLAMWVSSKQNCTSDKHTDKFHNRRLLEGYLMVAVYIMLFSTSISYDTPKWVAFRRTGFATGRISLHNSVV